MKTRLPSPEARILASVVTELVRSGTSPQEVARLAIELHLEATRRELETLVWARLDASSGSMDESRDWEKRGEHLPSYYTGDVDHDEWISLESAHDARMEEYQSEISTIERRAEALSNGAMNALALLRQFADEPPSMHLPSKAAAIDLLLKECEFEIGARVDLDEDDLEETSVTEESASALRVLRLLLACGDYREHLPPVRRWRDMTDEEKITLKRNLEDDIPF